MSNRYKGGIISATPPTLVAGAGASGTWTLEQQMQANAAGLWPVNGPFYIEDVFSTWLYTGNGTGQTITNGIDLAGKGGLVWLKRRDGAVSHILFDTARSTGSGDPFLQTNTTDAQTGATTNYLTYLSNGFTLDSAASGINGSGDTQVSWTFREQPKFFDVVTYTGNGTTNDVAHALGSVPGMVIIKKTSTTSNWYTLNRDSSGNYVQGYLNTTGSLPQAWTSANTSNYLTSTTLKIASLASITGEDMNASGTTYVAYLFAHNAGGFGLTGTDNVISCGSFTTNSSSQATVNLGYEPQWVLIKSIDNFDSWFILDNMRGWVTGGNDARLLPNSSNAEATGSNYGNITATGFVADGAYFANSTHIYIAIRRGPMKVPTTGTSVFDVDLAGNTTAPSFSSAFPVDLGFIFRRTGDDSWYWVDRLRGGVSLNSNNTDAEASFPTLGKFDYMNGYGSSTTLTSYTGWNFRRAPGFFDEVCYTGNFTNRTIAHNLAAVPELMIIKNRSAADRWSVYSVTVGPTGLLVLNTTAAADTAPGRGAYWNSTAPTASVFSVGQDGDVNNTGSNYVNYLFASCPGVSKVGSYTGTDTTQTINCGFTGGARFVLIKRTDSTGDWYVWDSARGIVAGNDPYLLLNSTAAEVTNTDFVDTAATGFEISSTAPAAINANGGTFIFLAIA